VARRLGLNIPEEMLGQLRYGRGLDNRRLKATGFRYRYTSREAVLNLAEHLRLHPILREVREPYRYEREVEEFLRWSPNVRDAGYRHEARLTPRQVVELRKALVDDVRVSSGFEHYDDLKASEIIPLLASLEPDDLVALRDHERRSRGRRTVLQAIDRALRASAVGAAQGGDAP
jgi:hypothetical protein